MKRAVVVYYSKYGHTKRYAEMISNAIGCKLYKLNEVNEKMLLKYDIIIYGGPINQDMIRGVNKFTTNQDDFEKQEFVVFADGMLMRTEKNISRILKANFSEEDLKKFKFFYLPGGFNYTNLDYGDMLIINYDLSKKSAANYGDKFYFMRRVYNKEFDFVSEKHIEEIISYIKTLIEDG